MEVHPNVEWIKREYQAFADGDFSGLARLFADEAVWHVRGDSSLAGDHVGRDSIVDFLEKLAREANQSFMFELHDILANDQHTVVLAHTTVQREEVTYTADEVHVFCTNDEGLITEAWGFTSDPAAQGRFWF